MHAQDLTNDKRLNDLIRTIDLTTPEDIYDCIPYGLQRELSQANARRLMALLAVRNPRSEPTGRSIEILTGGMMQLLSGGGVWIEHRSDAWECAWAVIHALEDGWITRKNNQFHITKDGLDRLGKAAA